MAQKPTAGAPAGPTDMRKYKVDTLNHATGTVMSGNKVLKRKPLYPGKIAPIPPSKDPMAKKLSQRKEKEKHPM